MPIEIEATASDRFVRPTSLPEFVERVVARAQAMTRSNAFSPSQQALLSATVQRVEAMFRATDAAQPLTLMYLLLRAWGREPDERSEHAATSALLYICAGDLIDDVQDDDLGGKPHERVGLSIAVNNGLTLVVLLLESLRSAMSLEPDRRRATRFLEAFLRNGRQVLGYQHVELEGLPATAHPTAVLEVQQGKNLAISTLMEFGAILAGCDEGLQARYSRAGRHLAGMAQVVDDLRDIFGKDESPDLRDGKLTFPVACFLESASEDQRCEFEDLLVALPGSMPQLRELFYRTGAVARCADALEELRREFHLEIAATGNKSAEHRLLLSIADAFSEMVYAPEAIPETACYFAPSDDFTRTLRSHLAAFELNLSDQFLPEAPRLVPWHLPHFEYDPDRRTIFYPDVRGLADEVLPFHVGIYGVASAQEARQILDAAAALLVPHEMFHFLRHQCGRLTEDRWHEEFVANRLAVAYGQRFCPDALSSVLHDAERILLVHDFDSTAVDTILTRCRVPSTEPLGYDTDMTTASVVHAKMVLDLAALSLDLDVELENLLGLVRPNAVAAE